MGSIARRILNIDSYRKITSLYCKVHTSEGTRVARRGWWIMNGARFNRKKVIVLMRAVVAVAVVLTLGLYACSERIVPPAVPPNPAVKPAPRPVQPPPVVQTPPPLASGADWRDWPITCGHLRKSRRASDAQPRRRVPTRGNRTHDDPHNIGAKHNHYGQWHRHARDGHRNPDPARPATRQHGVQPRSFCRVDQRLA
jgi:hypothetical protein